MKKSILIALLPLLLTACLKTRSDVYEQDQNAVYGKKNAENQMESQAAAMPVVSDEKDELIRNLNGRVEILENQLLTLQEDKESARSQDSQKIVLLQEALAKIETQLQKIENQSSDNKVTAVESKSSDDLAADKLGAKSKKLGTYDSAELHFDKHEWKKAIINFQKYTDESPRGKHVADAKYKIGLCFQELGMKEEAMAFYEEVVANYSKTDAGKKSKSRLAKLKK